MVSHVQWGTFSPVAFYNKSKDAGNSHSSIVLIYYSRPQGYIVDSIAMDIIADIGINHYDSLVILL